MRLALELLRMHFRKPTSFAVQPGTKYHTNNRLCKLRSQFPGLNYDSWTEGLYFKMLPIVMLTRLNSHGVPRNAFILRGSLPLSLWDL
jgi:hypothetical protein